MDVELLKKFRGKFTSQHIDPPSARYTTFDQRDVTRILEDDIYANSILRWKKKNVDDSVKLAADILEWRKKNNVTDLSIQDIGEDFYSKKSMFIRGRCNDKNRVLYFIGKRFTKTEEASAKKMFIYLLERLQQDDPAARVTFILDAGDCGMNNVDLGLIRLIVDSFMYYFPSLLGRTFIVDLPVILSAIWNIVKVWFDEELRNRTHHCTRKDLEKCFTLEQLQTVLGGKDTWEPSDAENDIASELEKEDESFSDAVENLHLNQD